MLIKRDFMLDQLHASLQPILLFLLFFLLCHNLLVKSILSAETVVQNRYFLAQFIDYLVSNCDFILHGILQL